MTNRNLKALADEGKFRPDLYYRLHVFPVSLPPLRADAGTAFVVFATPRDPSRVAPAIRRGVRELAGVTRERARP